METEANNEFTWVIKNYSTSESDKIYSDSFVIGGCKWRLYARVVVYSRGNVTDNLVSMYLEVAEFNSLPSGWRRNVTFSITIEAQHPFDKKSQRRETQHWFDGKSQNRGFTSIFPQHSEELKVVVGVNVLEVIGPLDVPPANKDVKGFRVLPSQVESVNRLFERHPDIVTNFHTKNQYLKTGYMNVLLSLTETVLRSPAEISKDDLADAYAALESLTEAGFKLDWLVKKFDQVSEKKKKDEPGERRMQELEKELKDLKRKFSDLEAKLEKKKARNLVEARASFSLFSDDIYADDFSWFGQ